MRPAIGSASRDVSQALRRVVVTGFAAGFVATLTLHQFVLALAEAAGLTGRTAFVMTPTPPLQVPALLSLAFWGGLWGIALAAVQMTLGGAAGYRVRALAFGALAPSAVSWLVSAPLHGAPLGYGWQIADMATSLLINAGWGLGTALLIRPSIGRYRAPAPSPPSGQKKAPGQGG